MLQSGTITLGSSTYDSSTTSYGVVLTKQNRAGTVLWSKFIDGDGDDMLMPGVSSCLAIADGQLFLVMLSYSSSLTVDTVTESKIGTLDSYLYGFDTDDGDLTYHRHFGKSGSVSQVLSISSSGNTVYWSGLLQDDSLPGSSASCSLGCASYGAIDASTGTDLWSYRWGGGSSAAYAITAGQNQDLYLSGIYQSTGVDIGTGSTFDSPTLASSFLEKVSIVDGSPVWIRKVTGTTDLTESTSVRADDNGNVYFSMLTDEPSLDFEGSGSSHTVTSDGGVIASYDSDGNFRWVTDPPRSYIPIQIAYDSKYQKLLLADYSANSTSMPFMHELDPADGTVLSSTEAVPVSVGSGALQGTGIALDPSNSSFVISAVFTGSIEINGTTYTTSAGNQTVLFEWK